MKRSGPIQRKQPLGRGKAIERKSTIERTPWRPTERNPIKPSRPGKRRRVREPSHTDLLEWADVRLVIFVRAGGRCEGCGRQLNIANMEGHHRRTRKLGPDCPCNALALCSDCHHGPTVHGGPEVARELGRIISRHSDEEPSTIPVDVRGERVLLTCGGMYAVAS